MAHLRGHKENQSRVQIERLTAWVTALVGFLVECFWVPALRLDLFIQTKKSWVFVNSTGALSKGHTKEGLGRRGGCLLIIGLLWKSHRELIFACDSAGMHVVERLVSVEGLHKLFGQTKWVLRQQYHVGA